MYFFPQDGDHAADDDHDDDGPREADLEGRVEKYIGVKVKVCIFMQYHLFSLTKVRWLTIEVCYLPDLAGL